MAPIISPEYAPPSAENVRLFEALQVRIDQWREGEPYPKLDLDLATLREFRDWGQRRLLARLQGAGN
jgi:hypothetical protein